jgi:CheY-like chemotaxis protein
MGGTSFAMDSLADDNPAQPALQIVLRSSEKAAHLTRQLLAYSGRGNASAEPVSISGIVRDTCEMVRSSVSRNVHLVIEPDPDVPDIETNASLMQQIVLNLVTNAAEAIGERNGVVTVRTAVESLGEEDPRSNVLGYQIPPGQYALLEVSDTGPGMDEKTQAQMFDPFFSTKFTGRGLGLAVVQGIVRTLIGAVQVHSAPGNGSTLRVLLPLRGKGSGLPGLGGFDPYGNKKVVLVIENAETLRGIVVTTLRRAGYEVIAASGGVAGLKMYTAHSERIGLILLDANLPDMPGIEALMNLRTLSAQVHIAVMTDLEREASSRFSRLGVVDFIQKPFAPGALETSVNKLLTPAPTEPAAGSAGAGAMAAGERGDGGGLTEANH